MRRTFTGFLVLCSVLFFFAGPGRAQSTLQPGMIFQYDVRSDQSGRSWPSTLKITSVTQATGDFSGEITWHTLNSVNRVDGKITGNRMNFKETQYIRRGDAHLNVEYTLTFENNTWKGTWVEPKVDRGTILIKTAPTPTTVQTPIPAQTPTSAQPPAPVHKGMLNGALSQKDGQYPGNFMGLRGRQILLVNRDPVGHPNEGKVMVVEFVKGNFETHYWEAFGDNKLLDGWLDPEDLLIVGDFLNLGYDQVMLFDRTNTGAGAYFGNNSRMMIVDFRNGKPPARVLFRSDAP